MDTAEWVRLVTRFSDEVVTQDELERLLTETETLTAYVGYAPTGEMHIGHFATIRKLVDFLDAGIGVTVLIADLHAHLDDEKSPFDLLDARSRYYEEAIKGMLEAAGADPSDVSFVRGTEYQLEDAYTRDLVQMLAETTIARAQRAGSEVIRQSADPQLGGLIYTLMQALDVKALDADIVYGGVDQRGIYMLARELLPSYDHPKPICVFAPLLAGLNIDNEKTSSSDPGSGVFLADSQETIQRKIDAAYCPAGESQGNPILQYLRYLVFPALVDDERPFVIPGSKNEESSGSGRRYRTYTDLESDFVSGNVSPKELRTATGIALSEVIDPVRKRLTSQETLLAEAYPERHG